MHKELETIIDRLVGAVKSDKPFYTLTELLSAGFPAFIVERIRIEINEKIKSDVKVPETIWVDMKSKLVHEEWMEFKNSLYSNSRIPQSEFYDLVKQVVNEIVMVYLEPRRYMTDYIYKSDEELGFEDIIERTNRLTIYKHFGKAIPLYMQKRKLKTLDRKRCKLLIQNLDTRLVSSYSAEDWAAVLELLFRLFGGYIDTKLIQLFFEDKGLYLTAKALNAIEGSINKERFIEVLSYPDLLDVNLQEKFKEQFKEELIAQKNRYDVPVEDEEEVIDEKEQALLDNFFGTYDYAVPPDQQESLNALFKAEGDYKSIFDDFDGSAPDTEDVHDTFKGDVQKRGEEMQEFRANLMNVLDEAVISFKRLDEDEKESEVESFSDDDDDDGNNIDDTADPSDISDAAAADEDADSEDGSAEEEDGDERPMWQKFLNDDHMDIIMGKRKKEDDSDGFEVEDDVAEEDIIEDATGEEEQKSEANEDDTSDKPEEKRLDILSSFESSVASNGKKNKKAAAPKGESLKEMLEPYKEYFSDHFFDGATKTFNSAIKGLEKHDNWKSASEHLNKKIFKKYDIDITSEEAVELTDLLQSYFKKNK